MYTSANKTRKTTAMKKIAGNSNRLVTNSQPLATNSKIKDTQIQIKIPQLINQRDLSKSKFMTLRTSKTSSAPLSGKIVSIEKKENRKPESNKKPNIPLTSANKIIAVKRNVLNENSSGKKKILKRTGKSPANEKIKSELSANTSRETSEISVQTNEDEILNHLLIVGDFKTITPSKSVTDEIDKLQAKKVTKKPLVSKRKFEEHSQKEEQHLDDLNEFLDKSFITRKLPKLRDNIFEEDRKLIESMDELLQREKPKIETISDIKVRIKRKERELLSLFDRFEQKNDLYAK